MHGSSAGKRVGDVREETGQVADNEIGGRRGRTRCFLPCHQHRAHAEGSRHDEISRRVLEHGCRRRLDGKPLDEGGIGRFGRFRQIIGVGNVEHAVEPVGDGQTGERLTDVGVGAGGHDELAPRQARQRARKLRIRSKRRPVDGVDIGEEVLGIDAVLLHQSAQRGAVAGSVLPLKGGGFLDGNAGHPRRVGTDAIHHGSEDAALRRIERVVEIEYPIPNAGKHR